ncbi:MAG: hypothetical protein AB1801_01200, partial [Chloroflexota bacterium]
YRETIIRLMWNEVGFEPRKLRNQAKVTKNSRNEAVFGSVPGPVSDFFSWFSFLFEAVVVQITFLPVISHQTYHEKWLFGNFRG